MSRRGLTFAAVGVAGGVGYYLYRAGGDPKVAQKQAEADASRASAKIRSEIPGREKQAEKKGEELTARLGAEADKAANQAKAAFADAQSKAQEYREKTGKELNSAIDKFDAKVEKGASQAKSGISSWFGGK